MQRLARVLGEARTSDGIFSATWAREHGLPSWTIDRLVDDGVLERVAPGHLRATNLAWDLRARQRQALIVTGSGSALAARSALHQWGIRDRPQQIEVLVPRGQRHRRPVVRIIQSTDLTAVDLTIHRGLQTSTPIRALLDAARFLPPLALQQAISAAISANLVDIDQLNQRFLEIARRGRPGVRKMRACLATFGVDPDATVFERDLERIIARGNFVRPVRQLPVKTDGKTYFLDHAWPELRKWSECDSMLAHGSAEDLRKDLERQNRIIAETGFEPMRFTYFDVHERPEYVTEILGRHIPKVVLGDESFTC